MIKNTMTILTAAALLSNLAVAQNTTTTATTVLASADSANTAANSNSAIMEEKSPIAVGYEGILYGPRMDFADGKQKAFESADDMAVSNRFRFKGNLTENMDAGIQARVLTRLSNSGVSGSAENFRLFSNIKKLLPSDVGSLTLTPRAVLPTSKAAHNGGRMISPELIAQYSIEPKNSRFSFNTGIQVIKYLYSSEAATTNSQVQVDSIGILEGTYQLSPKTKIITAYYPEMVKFSNLAYSTASNEVDFGFAFDVSKTWTLSPYLATELNYLSEPDANLLKSTGLMVTLTGSIL